MLLALLLVLLLLRLQVSTEGERAGLVLHRDRWVIQLVLRLRLVPTATYRARQWIESLRILLVHGVLLLLDLGPPLSGQISGDRGEIILRALSLDLLELRKLRGIRILVRAEPSHLLLRGAAPGSLVDDVRNTWSQWWEALRGEPI